VTILTGERSTLLMSLHWTEHWVKNFIISSITWHKLCKHIMLCLTLSNTNHYVHYLPSRSQPLRNVCSVPPQYGPHSFCITWLYCQSVGHLWWVVILLVLCSSFLFWSYTIYNYFEIYLDFVLAIILFLIILYIDYFMNLKMSLN